MRGAVNRGVALFLSAASSAILAVVPYSVAAASPTTPAPGLATAAAVRPPLANEAAPRLPAGQRKSRARQGPYAPTPGGTWSWQNPLPRGNPLYGVSCPSITTCFAVGELGQILASTDGGSHWVEQASGTSEDLTAISCTSTTACFVVGTSGVILTTGNGGGSWTPQASHTTFNLYGIACPFTNVCYAVGAGGTIARTFDGSTWSSSQPWGPGFLSGIDCVASSNCLAVGQGGFNLWSNTSGDSWYPQSSGTTHDLYTISCGNSQCIEVGAGGTIVSAQPGYFGTVQASGTSDDLFGAGCARGTNTCSVTGFAGTILTSTDGTTWVGEPSGTSRSLFAVSCPSAQTCAAVGEARTILTIHRSTWTPQNSGTGQGLNGLSCRTTSICFAVGDQGTIIATSNGGAGWSGLTSGVTTQLNAISCPSTTVCFAVGTGGAILATVDGSTWNAQTSNTTKDLFGISCPSTTLCFAVGSFETIDWTSDGGTTWTASSPGNDLQAIRAVDCPSTTTCFGVGDSGGPAELLWVTTNGGTSWSHHDLSNVPILITLSCPSASVCETAGQQPSHVYGSVDGGVTFSPQSTPLDPFQILNLFGSSCPSTTVCIMAGTHGNVIVTTNGGTLWQSKPVDDTAHDVRSVSCPSTSVCFGVGSSGTVERNGTVTAPPPGWVVRSPVGNTNDLGGISCPSASTCYAVGYPGTFLVSNDGVNWVDRSIVTTDELYGISCPKVTTCYAVGWPGAIYLTTNSGTTWSPQTNPFSGSTNVAFNGVSCPGPTTCVAVGSGGIILRTTNGSTWTQQPSGRATSINAVSCASVAICVAVGDYGVALRTSNGTSWSSVIINHGNFLAGVSCPSATVCYGVGYAGAIWVSTNGGASWTAQSSGVPASLFGIACSKATVCLATGSFGYMAITVDGHQWTVLNPPTYDGLASVAFPDVDHAWVAGLGGAILANSSLFPACTSVAIATDKTSPQDVGATVLLTATSAGCATTPRYRFYIRDTAAVWHIVQDFPVGTASYTWNTSTYKAGTYLLGVWVKDSSSGFTYDAYAFSTFTLVLPTCSSTPMTQDKPSPKPVGEVITFNTVAAGCDMPLYQWWLRDPKGNWTIVPGKDFPNSSDTFVWHTTGASAGTWQVGVWAKQKYSTRSYDTFAFVTFTLGTTGCSVTTSSDVPSPQLAGTTVTFTAASLLCDPPQYQWWVRDTKAVWAIAKSYAQSSATFAWNTTGHAPGTYLVGVWVRHVGSTLAYENYSFVTFTITVPAPQVCSAVNISPDVPSPKPPGTTVTFTALAIGCNTPDYRFFIAPPYGAFAMVQDYGHGPTFVWNSPGTPGPYQVGVWARQTGSSANYQAFAFITFQLS